MKRIILSLIAIVGFTYLVKAQQDPQYSMYMFNGLYLNPAYAGSKEVVDVSGLYRYQWSGGNFNGGAPQSATIGVHTPFKKEQYAIGVMMGYDHLGYTDMYNLLGMFAYRIPIKKSKLSLGMQTGFYHFNDNRTSAVLSDASDPGFAQEYSLYIPNVGAGIYAYGKRYYVGVSIPHILNMNISEKLHSAGNNQDIARQYRHIFFTVGGMFGRDEAAVKFKPSILLKHVNGTDNNIPDIDVNLSALFIDRFWLGVSARTGGDRKGPYIESIVGMFECLVTQQLRLGYSYDYTMSDLQQVVTGSHEVMLGYQFGYNKKKFVNVRYGTYF